MIIRISFHPEIRISGWKHLDFRSVDFVDLKLRSPYGDRLKLSPETLFQSVDFIDLNRSSADRPLNGGLLGSSAKPSGPSGRFLAIDDGRYRSVLIRKSLFRMRTN